MDVVLIAAAGVLAPLVVFALWRRIPPDPDMRLWLAHWASRLRPGRKPAAKSEARVDPVDHTGTPLSRPILAEHPDGRVAVGPGKGSVRDVTPTGSIRRLVVSARPRRSGSPRRNRSQQATADRTHSGRRSTLRMATSVPVPRRPALDARNSASRGAAYCHACGRRLVSDATSVPIEQAPAAAEGTDRPPKRKGVGSRSRTSPRLGRSSLP